MALELMLLQLPYLAEIPHFLKIVKVLDDGSIEATFSGGTAPYMVIIDGGVFTVQSSPYTLSNLGTGLHTIVVKDANECDISKEIFVDVIPCLEKVCETAFGYKYVGYTKYPLSKNGKKIVSTVSPGLYPYNAGSLADVTELIINYPGTFTENIYLIAHSVTCKWVYVSPTFEPTSELRSAQIVTPDFEASSLKVYPNPFSEKLNFEFVSDKNARAVPVSQLQDYSTAMFRRE